MEPRVSKRDRRLHLGYQVSHRIHCSSIYPVLAPNGSTLILYGYDSGLRVIWRGGRRPRDRRSPPSERQTNGASKSQDVIVIDDDDEEDEEAQPDEQDEGYESVEDEQDSEYAFPSIIQEVEVDVETAVLQMSVPALPPSTAIQSLELAKSHAIVALACANGEVLVLTIPLAPPKSSSIPEFLRRGITRLQLDTDGFLASDISVKLVPSDGVRSSSSRARKASETNKDVQGRLIVAADTKRLQLWSIDLTSTFMSTAKRLPPPVLRSPSFVSKVSFHPSSKSSELLFTDRLGAVRIYHSFASAISIPRPGSSGQDLAGKWTMSYLSPFQTQSDIPALARRKPILGAEWILGGRGIIVLLEDGEWGVWDLRADTQPGKTANDFALHGYLVSSSNAEPRDNSNQKKSLSKLAPMTPNTRKAKAEDLFSGTSKSPGVASTGGISVSQSNHRTGSPDESVLIWYNGGIYSIPSMQNFLQRNSPNKSGGLGGLYAPALTRISGIDLMNENITSVSQFTASSASTTGALGQINVQRDLLISAEHRFLIIQSHRSGTPGLFQQQLSQRPAIHDQSMLDAGELDLGGMDRMLDNMAGDPGARRVGFAH